MKKYLLLLFALLPIISSAQQLEPVDSLTAETILKKHLKVGFLSRTENVKDYYCGNPVWNYPGDKVIRNVTPGMGKFYLRPDYSLQQLHLDTPYLGFSTLYKLEIPDSTPRNDSIAGYNVYREYYSYEDLNETKDEYIWKRKLDHGFFDPWKSLTACLWLGQNVKTQDDFEYLNYSTGILAKRSNRRGSDTTYECEPKRSKGEYPYPLLAPKTDKEIENFLRSELMKNIYAYRLIKSGLLDSIYSGMYLREDINLFSFVDKLLPDMDCELLFNTYQYERGDRVDLSIWRFFYPGVDYIIHPTGEVVKDTVWSQYIELKPQYYVVAYDTVKELVHFLSGDDFFKTKNYYKDGYEFGYYLDEKNKIDSATVGYYRKEYVLDKIRAYSRYLYDAPGEDKLYPDGEDENYWYYKKPDCPVYTKLLDEAFNREDCPYNWFVLNEEMCDYYIRMSKKDYNIVEIYRKENCREKRRNEQNFVVPENKGYDWHKERVISIPDKK